MKAEYGLDAPGMVKGLAIAGGSCMAGGVLAYAVLRDLAPVSAIPALQTGVQTGIWPLAVSGLMIWSSKSAKFRVRDRVVGAVAWRGDEQVLDVGCGRGLALIGAARHLTTGRAIGVDIWSQKDLSANSEGTALANAQAEGVADRVTVQTGDARDLPFPDATFEVVLSMTALHNIPDAAGRARALAEIVRVLKPGGTVSLFDIYRTRGYRTIFLKLGLVDVRLSWPLLVWAVPGWRLQARKPG